MKSNAKISKLFKFIVHPSGINPTLEEIIISKLFKFIVHITEIREIEED